MALLVLVGAPVGLLAALIATSIVIDLFAHEAPASSRALGPTELLGCNGAVRELLDGLVGETARIQAAPKTTDERNLGAEWDAFAGRWQASWEAAGARCGFGDLEGTGLGAAYDRMAWVHRNLPTAKLKLRELVAHFAGGVGLDLAEMRTALDKSRDDLARRAERVAPGQEKP